MTIGVANLSSRGNILVTGAAVASDARVVGSANVSSENGLAGSPGPMQSYQRLKLCKRGYREAITPKVCGVSFEALPLWLWSIRLSEWSAIYITDTDEVRLRQYHVSTWEVVHEKLVIVHSTTHCSVDLWLASGSIAFLLALENQIEGPLVGWMSDGARRKPATSTMSKWEWVRVSHAMVGGVTKAMGIFGTIGIEAFSVPEDSLRRSISHVIKHSERPSPCSLPFRQRHYTVDHRLSLHELQLPVVFASGFSRTGWGQRSLVPSELAHAFDLPSFVSWESIKDASFVPIHMFRVILDTVIGILSPATQDRSGCRQKVGDESAILMSGVMSEVCPLPLDRVWIPTLSKWLPGSWTETAIANKAVKSDNAVVDFYPWHQRIMLVCPCPSAAIVTLEETMLRVWRRGLVLSFRHYLRCRYGVNWAEFLRIEMNHRCITSAVEVEPAAKRRRVLSTALPLKNNMGGGVGPIKASMVNSIDAREIAELKRDVLKGRLVLRQVLQSKWWEWSHGSALFFWRWNGSEQISAARDGMRIYVQGPLPARRKRMKTLRLSPDVKAQIATKIDGMRKRFYLESVGHVSNCLDYFAVPKGDSDIRVVFDGSACGLNEALWAPNFFLPSASGAAMLLTFNTWMADMDFGEMFHNFPMEERCSGVQFESKGSGEGGRTTTLLRWTRLFMGMRPSPYNAVRYYYWGEEFARGDPLDPQNPMGYDCIRLNLPGMNHFDPTLPKVMKWRTELGVVAGDIVTFVDDVRITGYSKENCHEVHRQFASRVQFLGMQDAPRKFRPPSQLQAGAWTGTIFRITPTVISKSVSQEKWEKGRVMISLLLQELRGGAQGRPLVDRKLLEKQTGFLNHMAMTFDVVTPFLKGFYLTLNSWRSQRDEGDWKLSSKRWKRLLFASFERGEISETELDSELFGKDEASAPQLVKASISLLSDVEALSVIFSPEVVPVVGVRSRHVITVVYGFGDASGTGLGATFTCGSGLNFRIGVWGSKEDPESSNWKEFTNVVESLEEEGEQGNLNHAEVFMFTDNSTVEACVSRGSSSSPKLLSLVVRLQALSLKVGIRINVFHIAGTRMVAQGTDGVSRGVLGQGVMDGEAMSAFVPLHLSAVERSTQNLVPWIQKWSGSDAILLNEMGWFSQGHDIEGWKEGRDGFSRPVIADNGRTYIWAPAPMSAEVAMAEMRKARIKRQCSSHIFVCPRLCTSQWLRQLYKSADCVFEVPVGTDMWSREMHEPLLIGILFPFISVKPWQLRGTPKMHSVGRQLRQVFQESAVDASNILRELWVRCVDLKGMSEPVVRKLLYFQ